MSTLGQAATTVVGAVVGFFIGGPAGAFYGAGIGMAVGGALFPPEAEVPNPAGGLKMQTSQYGLPVRYLRGRRQVPGNCIWYGNFQAHEEEAEGGKGGGGQVVGYTYSVSLAWGLAVVPVGQSATLLRVFEGSEEIPLSKLDYRFYNGNQTSPDTHVAEFVPRAPVWKRLCYIVLPSYDLGSSNYVKQLTFEIRIGNADDVPPTVVSADILCDSLFGLGLDNALYDSAVAAETAAWCSSNDLLIAPVFDRQVSVLDALSHIIAHHQGYIAYEDGQIRHRQLRREVSRGVIRDHHLPREEGELVLQAQTPGAREISNRVTVEWTKRAADYVTGTAQADDLVDIDAYGLRDVTVKLDALTSYDRAAKLALTLLRKSLAAPQTYTLPFGPELAGVRPGMVFELTEPEMDLTAVPVRVLSVSEADNYTLDVTLTDEVDIYDLYAQGSDSSIPPQPPGLNGEPGAVVRPLLFELPACYTDGNGILGIAYSRSGLPAWAGAAVYRAYDSGGSYARRAAALGSPVTGRISAVGENFLDVELDWDATLSSALSMDELVRDKTLNLLAIRTGGGDRYVKFKTSELLAERQWRLRDLIVDLSGFPSPSFCDIAINNELAFYHGIRHLLAIAEADRYRTLYYKFPSYNFAGREQSLADCVELSIALNAISVRPLPPCNLAVNGIGLSGAQVMVGPGDVFLSWASRNRAAIGAANMERTDATPEDADFSHFHMEFWRNGTLRRTVKQTTKSYTWGTSEQSADGGSGSVTVRFYQVNSQATSTKYEAIITFV